MKDEYLIWSNEHRLWWRGNGQGYTHRLDEAGIYTRLEAIRRSSTRDQTPGEPLPELPIRRDDLLSVLVPPTPRETAGQK
jgi:hypothetical protein